MVSDLLQWARKLEDISAGLMDHHQALVARKKATDDLEERFLKVVVLPLRTTAATVASEFKNFGRLTSEAMRELEEASTYLKKYARSYEVRGRAERAANLAARSSVTTAKDLATSRLDRSIDGVVPGELCGAIVAGAVPQAIDAVKAGTFSFKDCPIPVEGVVTGAVLGSLLGVALASGISMFLDKCEEMSKNRMQSRPRTDIPGRLDQLLDGTSVGRETTEAALNAVLSGVAIAAVRGAMLGPQAALWELGKTTVKLASILTMAGIATGRFGGRDAKYSLGFFNAFIPHMTSEAVMAGIKSGSVSAGVAGTLVTVVPSLAKQFAQRMRTS